MFRRFLFLLAPLSLVACNQADTAPKAVGGDRDAHGCIASAGYLWCAKTSQCERPWELAASKGFENTSQAFDKFCKG